MKRAFLILLLILLPTNKLLSQQELGPQLRRATLDNDIAEIDRLLKAGADPNWRDDDGTTLLKIALLRDHVLAVERMLAAGADPNLREKHFGAGIYEAGSLRYYLGLNRYGRDGRTYTLSNPLIVALLIAYGADVNEIEHNAVRGFTPLSLAAKNGHVQIVKMLLAASADPNTQKRDGDTALALTTNIEIFNTLLTAGADAEGVGITPLMIASFRGDAEESQRLLQAGADPNAVDTIARNTALHYAILAEHDNIIAILFANGTDPNLQTAYGWAALHEAASNGDDAIVELLLANGANPNLQTAHGWTALHEAASNGDNAIVESLLATGVDPNLSDNVGRTALQIALVYGHDDIVQMIERAAASN